MQDYFNQVTSTYLAAAKSKDSGWNEISSEELKRRGIRDWKRILFIDHEPTKKYIETLFSSAPFHTDKWHNVVPESENGLWVLTLSVSCDSSD